MICLSQVTIFGESAGGMSVYAHLMSPASAGLFSKAIAQSGVLNSAFVESDKHPAYYARSGLLCTCFPHFRRVRIIAVFVSFSSVNEFELQVSG